MIAALPLMLASCGFSICHACIKAPPEQEVPAAERGKIELIADAELPATAQHVFYYEQCGQDCSQWLRFELPEVQAREFAKRVLGGSALQKDHDPMPDSVGGYRSPKVPWWPARFPKGSEGATIETPYRQGGALVISVSEGTATIWLFEYDM